MSDNSAILKEFLIESFENLGNINEQITKFEKNPTDKELVNQIYRSVHTLKGSASFLGYKKLQELAHNTESLLDYIREGTILMDSEITDVLLQSFDLCLDFLKKIEKSHDEQGIDPTLQVTLLQNILERKLGGDNHLVSGKVVTEVGPEVATKIAEVAEVTVPKSRPVVKKFNQTSDEDQSTSSTTTATTNSSTPTVGADEHNVPAVGDEAKKNITDSVVRVNVHLLDKIMNVVGELVLNRNQILQFANNNNSSELNRLTQQLNVITTELQTDIMTTRMQPLGSIFSKYERVVRDMARELNKKIILKVIGQETELDKTLIEAIKDPLTHIIRNAIDHGLESIEDRRANKKSEEGHLQIRAFHEGGQVVIEISDDGKGINPAKILAKAVEKGLVQSEDAGKMSEEKIINLIFAPGFSTAEKITNISGRGVGMDVVKTNVEKIGGSVTISSQVNIGSTFKLKIPLTLAIVPALVIQSKSECFAIPQTNLVELVHLEGESLGQIEKVYEANLLRLRGKLIPLFNLTDYLKLSEVEKNMFDMLGPVDENSAGKSARLKSGQTTEVVGLDIVILNAEGHIYGIVVDKILDTEEIVVKPLGKNLKSLKFFAGATIMGDGRVALIVDALGFYNFLNHNVETKSDKSADTSYERRGEKIEDLVEYLLFKLRDERTYAIPLGLVSRLEEFDSTSVEYSGNAPIVQYMSSVMPLIDMYESLKFKNKNESESNNRNVVSCVVVSLYGRNFGLVVDEIIDISTTSGDLNEQVMSREGLLGTAFFNGKTVSLVDIYKVLRMSSLAIKWDEISNKLLQGKKILLVEDSPMYRQMEHQLLVDCGCVVTVANDGQEAWEKLEQGKTFDLVLTDIEMPRMTGHELSEKIRASKNNANIPIVAVTTKMSKKDQELSKKLNLFAHIEKFKKEEIIKVLEACFKEVG